MKSILLICFIVCIALVEITHAATKDWKAEAEEIIKSNDVVLFGKTFCPYCRRAKEALKKAGITFTTVELNEISHGAELQRALMDISGQITVPNVFCKGLHIGGSDRVIAAIAGGLFTDLLQPTKSERVEL